MALSAKKATQDKRFCLEVIKSNQIFHYTRCIKLKRVTSLQGPSPRHWVHATQLLSKCCSGGEPLASGNTMSELTSLIHRNTKSMLRTSTTKSGNNAYFQAKSFAPIFNLNFYT